MRTKVGAFVLALLLSSVLIGQQNKQAEIDLQAAIRTQNVKGDLKEAIKEYETIVSKYSNDRAIVARALLNLAECHQTLGSDEARRIYERLARENQPEAAEARRRLAALAVTAALHTPASSLVTTEDPIGPARNVFITPDGSFLSMPSENRRFAPIVVLQDMSNGKSERLREEGTEAAMVSPDGRTVALVSLRGNSLQGNLRYELRVRDNEPNSDPVVVLDSNREFSLAAWSKDSKSILLTRSDPDRNWEIAWLSIGQRTVKTVASLGWRYTRDRPSLSPDGRYIAYSALASNPDQPPANTLYYGRPLRPSSGDRSIHVVSADGSSPREIVKGASINEAPIWTEDGSHILFLSDRTGTFALYAVAIENGREKGRPFPVRGAAITERIIPVGMTSSGSYYYVKERFGGTERLFQMQVGPDGKVRGPSVHVSDNVVDGEASVGPSWSPDGTRFAFKKQVNRPIGGKSPNWVFDLIVRNENGEETSYIHKMNGGAPVWMHDGNRLLVTTATTNYEIYQVDLKTKEFTLVYTRPPSPSGSGGPLAISPDDKTIYFLEDDNIVSLDLPTRERHKISTLPSTVWTFSLSPDGRILAMSAGDGPGRPTHVARVNVDGTGYVKLAPSGRPGLAWSSDGHAILYIGDDNRLMRIPANGGVPEFVGLTFNGQLFDFALKPDGSQIAFSSVPQSELWKIDNLSSVLKSER
jgi:Tol biopolymer transport system component